MLIQITTHGQAIWQRIRQFLDLYGIPLYLGLGRKYPTRRSSSHITERDISAFKFLLLVAHLATLPDSESLRTQRTRGAIASVLTDNLFMGHVQ